MPGQPQVDLLKGKCMQQLSLGQKLLVIQDRELDAEIKRMLAQPRSEHDSKTRTDAVAFFDGVQRQLAAEIGAGQPITPIVIDKPVDWAVMPPDKELHLLWRDFQRWAANNGLHPVVTPYTQGGRPHGLLLTIRSSFGPL
jgi:hypothetical protein